MGDEERTLYERKCGNAGSLRQEETNSEKEAHEGDGLKKEEEEEENGDSENSEGQRDSKAIPEGTGLPPESRSRVSPRH